MEFVRREYKNGKQIDGKVVVGFKSKVDEGVSYTLLPDSLYSCQFLNGDDVFPVVSVGKVRLQKTNNGLEPAIENIEIYTGDELESLAEDAMKKARSRFEKEGRLEDYLNNEGMLKQNLLKAYRSFNIVFGKTK